MDWYKLDSAFAPTSLIENYSSAIWTERYSSSGDFEIITTNVPYLFPLLTLGDFVSHAKTNQVCIVENKEITQNEDGAKELKVSGRTIDCFLEHRGFPINVNGTSYQPLGVMNAILNSGTVRPSSHPRIFTTNIHSSASSYGAEYWESGEMTSFYDALWDYLNGNEFGIRSDRRSITVGTPNQIRMQLYKGTDISAQASAIFSVERGDIADAKYLWTNVDKKNVVWMKETDGLYIPVDGTGTTNDTLVGYDRREGLYPRQLSTMGDTTRMQTLGRRNVKKHQQQLFVEATATPEALPTYKVQYDLGDTIMFHGDYNVRQTLTVEEYTYISDGEGDRDYPAFAG